MQIDLIDDLKEFEAIKPNWDFVYESDPQAQFFLSWEWLSGWLPMVSEPWLILAAKINTENNYVAFFPIKISLTQDEIGTFYTELCMAGNSMADYTGLLCLPGNEAAVISAFAAYIQQQLVWCNFELQNILETDRRIHQFLTHFSRESFELSQRRSRDLGEESDHMVAPYIPLLDHWDDYLQDIVSSNTRQKIRRFLKKIDNSEQFHITPVNAHNLSSHIEILLDFWQKKWGEKKGDNCQVIATYIRRILDHCFEQDCLYFPVLWQGDTPLGTIANFIDRRHKTILFFIAGRDETVKSLPPGLILHADAIRYAIQNGFKIYDFLRGNDDYKYSFGVKERHLQHFVIKPKTSQAQPLDIRGLPLALQHTLQHHRSNQLTEAEQEYHQILSVQPDHSEALYYLAALMKQKGEYEEAEALIKRLLASQPNSGMAWFSLGNLYQAQGQLSAAIAAYRQSITFQPNSPTAYNNLGYALQQQEAWEEAIACYQKALELQSDCTAAEVNLSNLLHAQTMA
ncbi:MAG: GNAT family N-acetyltransferase [Leptolyngbyaceae cyanobacterium SL_7_1]|nr:GNAT family N-acetyltransferase [Leptolyngbyaceae cyanobacterium SL_7_1]